MKTRLVRARWDLIGKAALVVYIVTFLLGLGLTFPVSALLTWSHLDPQRAGLVASVISALLVLVVTGAGAWWVAHRVTGAALLHGFLVGLVVALLSFVFDVLFLKALGLVGLGLYVLMVVAGVLGGIVGSRRELA